MKRNLLLMSAILVSIILGASSARKILSFKTTSGKVVQAEARLEELKKENEELKRELEHKKGQEFAEAEIRNKLGLAREGEAVVVVPKENSDQQPSFAKASEGKPNWQKWRDLILGRD